MAGSRGGAQSTRGRRVNFDFSAEQLALREYLRAFLRENCPIATVRRVLDGERAADDALWRQLGELGYLGAAIPAAYGGAGLGYLELCVIAEELGRALAPVPFASSIAFAAEFLLHVGSEAQKRAWLPQIASGASVATVAALEPATPLTPDRLACRLSGGRVYGIKTMVPDGQRADLAVVLVADEAGGAALVLVDLREPGVRRREIATLEPTRAQADLQFDGVVAERIGAACGGWRCYETMRNRAAVLMAFEQLGGADRCLEMARNYALERRAFGRPIGSFQAIKHKLADIYLRNTLARGHAYYGAWALESDAPELSLAAAGARVAGTNAFNFAAQENIQVHGGVGFTWEYDCHLYLRRARLLALALGNLYEWKERIVTELEKEQLGSGGRDGL